MTMRLGDIIKQARKEQGLTQEELADKIGLTRYAILKYEKGIVSDIPINKRIAIADALSLPLNKVLTEQEYNLYLCGFKESQEDYTVFLHKSKMPAEMFTVLFRLEDGENPDNFIIHHKSEFTPESFEQLKKFIEIMKLNPPSQNVPSGRTPRHQTYTEDFSGLVGIEPTKKPPKEE